MTVEPVAYWRIPKIENEESFVAFSPSDNSNFENIPLYTKEQLQTRVKMTQNQYDRLMWEKQNTDLSTCLGYFLEHDGVNKFGLPSENLMGFLKQEDIARAWLNPEKTIEIVPTMKWFVRSKKRDGFYYVVEQINYYYPTYKSALNDIEVAKYGHKFKTKEQAEEWKNPLTEVVLLPVGE